MFTRLLSPYLVSPDHYKRITLIESGSRGELVMAVDPGTGLMFAVRLCPAGDEKIMQRTMMEIEILARNTHPATLSLDGVCLEPTSTLFAIVGMSFCPNGSLELLLNRDGSLDATRKSKAVFGIVAGLASLHGRGVIHRTFSTRSVFLDHDFEPVIGSFGFAHYWGARASMMAGSETPLFLALEGEKFDKFWRLCKMG
jgi:serine/threonine protein kinase